MVKVSQQDAISKEGSSCYRDKNVWDLNCTFLFIRGRWTGMHGWNVIYGPKEIKGSWVYSAGTLLLTGATVELDLIGGLWSLSYEIRKRSCRQAILEWRNLHLCLMFLSTDLIIIIHSLLNDLKVIIRNTNISVKKKKS